MQFNHGDYKTVKKAFWIYTIAWLIFLFFLNHAADGYYGDLATDRESFTVGVAGQNRNQTTSITALLPLKKINGWVGTYVSRQTADGMVTSETVNAHLQGGFRFGSVGVEAYAETTRDKWRAIDLAIETGYFVRPAVYTWQSITISGGAGNYTERRDVDEEIGRDADDVSLTFGWIAFVSAKWKNLSGVVRYKPSFHFEETVVESSLSFNHTLSDQAAVGITTQSIFDTQSVADGDLHSSYLIQLTYTP